MKRLPEKPVSLFFALTFIFYHKGARLKRDFVLLDIFRPTRNWGMKGEITAFSALFPEKNPSRQSDNADILKGFPALSAVGIQRPRELLINS